MVVTAPAVAGAPSTRAGWEGENVLLTAELRTEYEREFAACAIGEAWKPEAEATLAKILAGRPRYESVATRTHVPWYVVAVIHSLECGGNFKCHLHNGDPLTARTTDVPAGRPVAGHPPFAWETSAIDALQFDGLDVWREWSVPGTLYKLELFNGTGYRHHGIPTPYLWSGSQIYTRGKYVSDGRFDPSAVSKEIGAAVLLRDMADQALITFPDTPAPPDPKCVGLK
jgi:lysozyme family protein